MSRKRRAELVFYQLSDRWSDENQNWIGRWVGRLLAADNCIDQATGLPVTWNPYWLIEEHPDGHFNVELQGGEHHGGRRYSSFSSFKAAQEAGLRWGKRRFYYAES